MFPKWVLQCHDDFVRKKPAVIKLFLVFGDVHEKGLTCGGTILAICDVSILSMSDNSSLLPTLHTMIFDVVLYRTQHFVFCWDTNTSTNMFQNKFNTLNRLFCLRLFHTVLKRYPGYFHPDLHSGNVRTSSGTIVHSDKERVLKNVHKKNTTVSAIRHFITQSQDPVEADWGWKGFIPRVTKYNDQGWSYMTAVPFHKNWDWSD